MEAFRPLPLLGNPHVQTVVAHLFDWSRDRVLPQLHRIDLPDGDALAIHESTPPEWRPSDGCAVLVHGLGGTHRSGYMRRVANKLLESRVRVYRLDLRGAGAGWPWARKFYNAGASGDVRAALDWTRERNPESPLVLAGFSLGGNLALKMVGEAGDAPPPGLVAVASVAAPICLTRCAAMIANLPFYDRFYAKQLTRQVRERARQLDDPAPEFPKKTTLRQFDALYTAPRGGFANVEEYYRSASSAPLLASVRVPAYLLTARDDPFVAWEPYAELPTRSDFVVRIAPRGGHLGFLGRDGLGGVRWAEVQVVSWIVARLRVV